MMSEHEDTPWPKVYGQEFIDWWDRANHTDRIRYLREGAPYAYSFHKLDPFGSRFDATYDAGFNQEAACALIARTAGHPIPSTGNSLADQLEALYRREVMQESRR